MRACCVSIALLIALLMLVPLGLQTASAMPPHDDAVEYSLPRSDEGEKLLPSKRGEVDRDQVTWGFYTIIDGEAYAVEGETWTWDHGAPDLLEGWEALDIEMTDLSDPWWARVTPDDFECPDEAPMILGTAGQLWVGKQQSFADLNCWACDAGLDCSLGYQNELRQRVESPSLLYTGGDITLEFDYFSDSEDIYDHTRILLVQRAQGADYQVFQLDDISGRLGDPQHPAFLSRALDSSQFPPDIDSVRVRFEFVSDGGWSDEDGPYCSVYGPFGADNVTLRMDEIEVASYDFDDDNGGWLATALPIFEVNMGVHHVTEYGLPDTVECGLEENVLAFHNDDYITPIGTGVSPIVDLRDYPTSGINLYARWNMNSEWFSIHRPGWLYYPSECPQSGVIGWGFVPETEWRGGYQCGQYLHSATEIGVPTDAELVRFVLQVQPWFPFVEEGPGPPVYPYRGPLFDNLQVCLDYEPSTVEPGTQANVHVNRIDDNRPNPFSSRTVIRFTLSENVRAELNIYDVAGRLVRRLDRGSLQAGVKPKVS